MTTTNGGQADPRRRPTGAAAQGAWRSTSRISRSRIRTRRSRCSPDQQPQINIQINVNAKPLTDTDIEVTLRLEGKAEANSTVMFSFELEFAGVFRIQNVPQEQHSAGGADRMPAAVVPVRARDHRDHRCATAASRR